jgi:GTP-binding protein
VEADVEWRDVRFRLIDTGGYETDEENVYASLIVDQVKAAIEGAAVILFCVDARDGLTASDYDMADVVRRARRPTVVVANKSDNEKRELTGIAEASSLGLGEPVPVSALHYINVSTMLDSVIALLPEPGVIEESDRTRIAIIGRPNVGKSALVNAILGQKRVIVSDVAGTTRDAIDTEVDAPEGSFLLIDTAGIRRPGKLGKGVERHSVMRSTTAVERCDVAVLVIDGVDGVTAQDTHIAGIAMDHHKGLIIAVNKTDLWEDPEAGKDWAERQMRGRVKFAPWAMVTFISALEGRGLNQLLTLASQARDARRRRMTTGDLNALLSRAMRDHVPPLVHNKRFKLFYATQAGIDPPTFILFVNDPELVHFSYRRYLERAIREAQDFEGTAIKLVFRARTEDDSRS